MAALGGFSSDGVIATGAAASSGGGVRSGSESEATRKLEKQLAALRMVPQQTAMTAFLGEHKDDYKDVRQTHGGKHSKAKAPKELQQECVVVWVRHARAYLAGVSSSLEQFVANNFNLTPAESH